MAKRPGRTLDDKLALLRQMLDDGASVPSVLQWLKNRSKEDEKWTIECW